MRRLDSPFFSIWFKGQFYALLAFLWGLTSYGFLTGNEKARPLFYILPPFTVFILWWLSGFKRVTLDGDTLIVYSFGREMRIPVSRIEKIREFNGRGGALARVIVVFKPGTECGRRVRIISSGVNVHPVAELLRRALEGRTSAVKISHAPPDSMPVANRPNQKEIIIKGWTENELSTILTDFTDANNGRLNRNFDFAIRPDDHGSIRMTFPHDIPPLQFSLLINYLQYPKNCDSNGRTISVIGKALISAEFRPPVKDLIGKSATFYVPANDRDYDVIYVRIGEETFANSFASTRWKKVADARIPAGLEIG